MRTHVSKQRLAQFNLPDRVYGISCHEQCNCRDYGPTCRRGFFSLWIQAIYGTYFSGKLGKPVHVNFGDKPYLYTDLQIFPGESNFWNYYYRQQPGRNPTDPVPSVIVEDYPLRIWNRMHVRQVWKDVVSELELQPSVRRYIEKLTLPCERYKTLGVHIRGTDHGQEVPQVSLNRYFRILDKELQQYEKLYVCTDQSDILQQVINRYGEQVIYQTATRSIGETPVHTDFAHNHRYRLGLEVLADAYALSSCQRAILVHSNVSYGAYLLNPGLNYALLETPVSRWRRYRTLLVYYLDRWRIRKM